MSRTETSLGTTHLAMTSDISTAATCGWKYRLPKIFGVPTGGSFSGLVGWVVHDVLSRSGGPIHETWKTATDGTQLTQLRQAVEPVKKDVFLEWREKFVEGTHTIDEFLTLAGTRLEAMLEGLSELMADHGPPARFLTEIQITNPETHHQGRVDALAEWEANYATIDYKTYDDEAPRSHGYDHFQIVANGMLTNYRNRRPESDFSHNQLVILYPGGRRYPRPTERVQEIVREARAYVLAALSSSSTDTVQVLRVPKACWVCQRPDECNFYRGVERMHREGTLPSDEDELRRLLWQRRYRVLDFRQISHRWDETAQARPEQGFEVMEHTVTDRSEPVPITVVGDDMQARPISPNGMESGILSRLRRSRPDAVSMLRMSYRLPEPNVDMTSAVFYEGKLDSPPEVRSRRLELHNLPVGVFRQIIDPTEPLTFADVKGGEVPGLAYSNNLQVRVTREIVNTLQQCGLDTTDPNRLLVLAPQKGQVIETLQALSVDGLAGENVTTVTRSLGLEADVVVFQTVRSNKKGYLGMTGVREVLNVATSRCRMKLIIVGDWSTFADGIAFFEGVGLYSSRSRKMASFIQSHGTIVDVPIPA